MLDKLEELRLRILSSLGDASDIGQLEELRVRILGKKGELTQLLRSLGGLSPEDRPRVGARINELRADFESRLAEHLARLEALRAVEKLRSETLDVTLPGSPLPLGRVHPITQTLHQMLDIFVGMGFEVVDGYEIEEDHYNFELLNMPKDHPAREMQDTFYFNANLLLRTHTSPSQARTMTTRQPPIRIVCPGRVYRSDYADATHSPIFHQMECLVVDEGITMADLKGTLDRFAQALYGPGVGTRFRPSYFPFTEPSAEVDVTCAACKGKGCRTCKGTGWLEILGAGMVNPRVLSLCGIDPERYTGFAFGVGLDRVTMLKYNITDMRLLFDNDMRFLQQFREGDAR